MSYIMIWADICSVIYGSNIQFHEGIGGNSGAIKRHRFNKKTYNYWNNAVHSQYFFYEQWLISEIWQVVTENKKQSVNVYRINMKSRRTISQSLLDLTLHRHKHSQCFSNN